MLIFDQSLQLDPIWVDFSTMKLLNSLRDDVAVVSSFENSGKENNGEEAEEDRPKTP